MLPRIEVETMRGDLLEAYRKVLQAAPEFLLASLTRTYERNRQQLEQALQVEPANVSYPILWKSEKQRKAFFASNGFGHGIPHKRDHKLAKAWAVGLVFNVGGFAAIEITNPTPYLKFVEGEWQQPFHERTGWLDYRLVAVSGLERLEEETTTDLIRSWYAVGED